VANLRWYSAWYGPAGKAVAASSGSRPWKPVRETVFMDKTFVARAAMPRGGPRFADHRGRRRHYRLRVSNVSTGFVTVHGPAGDWSIFRPKGSIREKDESRKHGPVPLPAEGDSPIFAAKDGSPQPIPPPPRKLGQSPVNGYQVSTRRVRHASPARLDWARRRVPVAVCTRAEY